MIALLASGIVTSSCASWFCSDVAFQAFIASPGGTCLALLTALFVVASIVLGVSPPQRGSLLVAVAITVSLDLGLLAVGVKWRWLSGVAFNAPLANMGIVYGPAVAWYVATPLMIYAWLAVSSKRWALMLYAVAVLVFFAVSLGVVRRLLLNRIFVFAGGYSVVWDSIWGVAQYALALLLYRQLSEKPLADHLRIF